MLNKIGVPLIIFLSLVPILLWSPTAINTQFNFRHVSQVLGLSGAVLLSINFILAARIRLLENLFNGLNRIYIIHHLVGVTAFILLLLHPVMIGIFYWQISFESAFAIIFPPFSSGFATWFGFLSLTTFILLMIFTLYIKLPYNVWKLTHKFIGLVLALALVHIIFINSTITTSLFLRYYILFFCIVGLLAYVYRTILGKYLAPRIKFRVSDIKTNHDVSIITLTPDRKNIKYDPGQFIFIKFSSLGITKEEHPFSLISAPNEDTISIAAKHSGDYTETLKLLKSGSQAIVEGPFGRFSYLNAFRKNQIWIAGGIGITPFISMAKSLHDKKDYQITLYYMVKNEAEAIFLKDLLEISNNNPHLHVVPFYTSTSGHLSAEVIAKDISDFNKREIFVCGPPPMMKSIRKQFNKLKVKNSHIRTEEFSLD